MADRHLYPFGVPLDPKRQVVTTGNALLSNPSDIKMRTAPKTDAIGFSAGKGHGKGGLADGMKRSSGSIEHVPGKRSAGVGGLKAGKKGLANPFGVKIDSPT